MNETQTIRALPDSERPRERCLRQGAECLSLRECLALLIGSGPRGRGCLGLASDLLDRPGTGLPDGEQERAFFTAMEVSALAHLENLRGIGSSHRARLLAAFEIGRRYAIFRERTKGPVHGRAGGKEPDLSARALERVSPELRQRPQEWLGFVPVHRFRELGELCLVEQGVRTHVNVDPAELFARILALRPQGFYLFHNHPSGECTPSLEDFDLTERVRDISGQLGIRLLGHWIVAPSAARMI